MDVVLIWVHTVLCDFIL